jgi:hypothetical protein
LLRTASRAGLLHVGAMFHDVGLIEAHPSEHERFEIDGANVATAFAPDPGLSECPPPGTEKRDLADGRRFTVVKPPKG